MLDDYFTLSDASGFAFGPAQFWLKCDLLDLHSKVIISPLDKEVSVHAPFLSVGIPDNPVFGVSFFVLAPSYDDDRVVHVHPGDALVVQSLV